MWLKTWKDYKDFRDWCKAQHPVVDKYGREERITEYLYDWEEKDFTTGHDHPVFKAPCYVDAVVIRNCPLEAMQNELKLHYGSSYEDIKAGKLYASPCSDIQYTEGRHCKCVRNPGKMYNRPIEGSIWVQIDTPDGIYMRYSDDTDTWDLFDEYVISSSSSNTAHVWSIKALKRHIRKWRLPVGTVVHAIGCYVNENWDFVVKL